MAIFPVTLKLKSAILLISLMFHLKHSSLTLILFSVIFSLRLRRKNWKNPGRVYVDSQIFEENIQVYASFEVFLEILEGL